MTLPELLSDGATFWECAVIAVTNAARVAMPSALDNRSRLKIRFNMRFSFSVNFIGSTNVDTPAGTRKWHARRNRRGKRWANPPTGKKKLPIGGKIYRRGHAGFQRGVSIRARISGASG